VAAAQRSQARASSGEDASRAPRTWLVSNLQKHGAFELLPRIKFSFFFISNWARKVAKGTNFFCARPMQQVFISGDARKNDGNLELGTYMEASSSPAASSMAG
jgi:hypothetical protein